MVDINIKIMVYDEQKNNNMCDIRNSIIYINRQ